MIRLFTAVELPSGLRDSLADSFFPVDGVRWTPANQLHITLRFIGNADSDRVKEVLSALHFPAFTLRLTEPGFFPSFGKPKIFWMAVEPVESLINLKSEIDEALGFCNILPDTRSYIPHVTLARVKKHANICEIRKLKEVYASFAEKSALSEFQVSSFTLFSSSLSSEGAEHIPEEYIPLL